MQLPTLKEYTKMSVYDNKTVCMDIIKRSLYDKYRLIHTGKKDCILPLIQNVDNGIFFNIIFYDTYNMGLSQEEEKVASSLEEIINLTYTWLRPVHKVEIRPCIVSTVPVLVKEYNILKGNNIGENAGNYFCPVYVDYQSAKKCCFNNHYRLPTEEEWEYICRSGTTTLFTWGNEIPPEPELEKWLLLYFYSNKNGVFYSSNHFTKKTKLLANRFGFYGLYSGEWCSNKFAYGYSANDVVLDERVIRGGGSLFWPWQFDEWTWCISAGRRPSSYVDNKATFRLVKDIGNEY